MGYACPVCATPQRDGEHLAHHLAFTAMLHGDDHEAWLDDHAPDWQTADPGELAEDVVDHADPAEYHEVFEDTTDRGRPNLDAGMGGGRGQGARGHSHGHDHAHDHGPGHGHDAHGDAAASGSDPTDPETAAALEEARELTRRMYEGEDGADVEETSTDSSDSDSTDADPSS
ncbi:MULTISPECIES: DUF5810 domain-containing protein [Haloferacaceae]|uniref:DUF5810 domain-containing protein n=1 Tax=Halorubrum glutamatedens TaxID=2707018 RepID=A0ABD5QQI1_9EURY|nr:DUF5810 domain-containing protein [Halobellus captivus]